MAKVKVEPGLGHVSLLLCNGHNFSSRFCSAQKEGNESKSQTGFVCLLPACPKGKSQPLVSICCRSTEKKQSKEKKVNGRPRSKPLRFIAFVPSNIRKAIIAKSTHLSSFNSLRSVPTVHIHVHIVEQKNHLYCLTGQGPILQ